MVKNDTKDLKDGPVGEVSCKHEDLGQSLEP